MEAWDPVGKGAEREGLRWEKEGKIGGSFFFFFLRSPAISLGFTTFG